MAPNAVDDDDIIEEGPDVPEVGMDPNHPLLARAQAALKGQLISAKERAEH